MTADTILRSLALAAAITTAHAQHTATQPPQRAPLGADAFLAPIHDAADDQGARYGTWASGPDYKVSFHGGLTYYPVLGASAPENLPLRWVTTDVRVGDHPLARIERAEQERSEWRIEFDVADGIVEAYDVRPDGVEQTFVIERRPAHAGDLRIRGAVDTPLRATPGPFRHGGIVFRDDAGTPIIEYGAATVIDAHGAALDVDSRWSDGAIELRVPGEWLARASYPVVVDPLIGRVRVDRQLLGGGAVGDTDVDWIPTAQRCLFVYSRAVSASDHDAYARVTDESFQNGSLIYTDVTASWSTPRVCCAYSALTLKWIVVVERAFPTSGYSGIRWHLHGATDPNLSTSYAAVPVPSGETNRFPDVGGTSISLSGHDRVLIVYQADVTDTQQNTASSSCHGVLVDTNLPGNGVATPRVEFSPPVQGTLDREFPAVNQSASDTSDPWVVGYQFRSSSAPSSNWRIRIARIYPTGVVDEPASGWLGSSDPSMHSERVQIAGQRGRYTATFLERTGGFVANPLGVAPRLRAHRFDWDHASAHRSWVQLTTVVDSPTDLLRNGGLAYDRFGGSHWAATYETNTSHQVLALRLGARAGIAESVVVHDGQGSDGAASSITLHSGSEFAVAFGTDEQGFPLYADSFGFGRAETIAYGTICGSGLASWDGTPHAGNEYYGLQLFTATPSTAAAVLIGLAPAATPLASIGMPGCVLNVDPAQVLLSGGTSTSNFGSAYYPLPLPAPLNLSLYTQWAYLAPGLNALGLAASNGVEVRVR